MKKAELSTQTKTPTATIDEILSAAGFATDLDDYADEHLKFVVAVKDIHKKAGAKSWAEAVGLYHKPAREQQLKEIAQQHEVSVEIPDILSAIKVSVETITEAQMAAFREVCRLLQSGVTLDVATKAVLNEARSAAITTTTDSAMVAPSTAESVPPDARTQIDAVALAVGPMAVPDVVAIITDEAVNVEEGFRQYSRAALYKAIEQNPRPQGTPEEAVALFKQKQAQREAQRNGN